MPDMPGNGRRFGCSVDGGEEGRLAQSFEHTRPICGSAREKSSIIISLGPGLMYGSVVSTVTPQWSEIGSVSS